MMTTTTTTTSPHHASSQQPNGFRPFSEGDLGRVHDRVHQLIDDGRSDEAYALLRGWLAGREGSGSEWVHLQWHMAVLEIGTGSLRDAVERFRLHILPAVEADQAATDAPSLLWRLVLAGGCELGAEWDRIHDAVDRHGDGELDPYVELHDALALAGAGDVRALDRWLDARLDRAASEDDRILLKTAWALRSYASHDYAVAAALLAGAMAEISRLGGSRAQNVLFEQIRWAASSQSQGRELAA